MAKAIDYDRLRNDPNEDHQGNRSQPKNNLKLKKGIA